MSHVAIWLILTVATVPAKKPVDTTMPSVIFKQEPFYSDEARQARAEGEVWISAVVTTAGLAEKFVIMRSVGFGLDEQAIAAVRAWRFKPAMKNGKPIDKLVTIAVSFHMEGGGTNFPNELRRNLVELGKTSNTQKAKKVAEQIESLAAASFPAAMYEYAQLLRNGKIVPQDEARANDLTLKAANARYGPAIWELVQIGLTGDTGTPPREDVRKLVVLAANSGSKDAQYFLGRSFQEGLNGYAVNIDEAQHMHLTCANGGFKQCWYPAGRILLLQQEPDERDLTHGFAFLELAKEQGVEEADSLLEQYAVLLTDAQKKAVKSTKQTLLRSFGY